MQAVSAVTEITGKPLAAWLPFVDLGLDAKGDIVVERWDATSLGVAAPTATSFAALLAAPEPSPTQAQLIAYASAKQVALRDGGITVNVGTSAAPMVVDVATDADGRDMVAGNVQYIGLCAQMGQPAPTFNWINDPVAGAPGAQITLTADQMKSLGLTLRAFVQAGYDALGTVGTAIANGTITTTAGVDAATWPPTAY